MDGEISVLTDFDRSERLKDLAYQDELRRQAEASGRARAKKNQKFVQIYGAGFQRIAWLAKHNQSAELVYLFLAEHLVEAKSRSKNLVVVSQQEIANSLGMHLRTVQRAVNFLVKNGVIARIKIGAGSVFGYGMNPEEVYAHFDYNKKYAVFDAKVVASTADNPPPGCEP